MGSAALLVEGLLLDVRALNVEALIRKGPSETSERRGLADSRL